MQLEQEIGQAAVARYVEEQEESCEEEYFDSDEEECYTDNDQEYYYNDGEPVYYNDDSDEYSDSDEEEYNGWYWINLQSRSMVSRFHSVIHTLYKTWILFK